MRRRSRNIPKMQITKNADSRRSPQRLTPEPHFSSPFFRQILPTKLQLERAAGNFGMAVRRERLVSASL
jgi:hypothetical protein